MHVMENKYGRFLGFRDAEGKGGGGGNGAGGGEGNGGGADGAGAGDRGGAGDKGGGEGEGEGGDKGAGSKAGGTILDDGDDKGGSEGKPGRWPDDWKAQMADGDADTLKLIDRYDSPKAAAKALREAQNKIRSGQVKTPLPDNPTAEQITAYRKDNGIPEAPEGYEKGLKLPKGLVVGEADKPILASFLKDMHGGNATQAEVNRAVNWYYTQRDAEMAARHEGDKTAKRAIDDAMREEWGPDFRVNQRVLKEYVEGTGMQDLLVGARGPDGNLLLANSKFVSWMTNKARDENPIATVVPNSGGTGMATASARMAELEKMSADTTSDYWKRGKVGAALQQEMRDLIDAQERQKARAK